MPGALNCKKPVNVSLRYVEGYVYAFKVQTVLTENRIE
jgi:hypothetical protein